MKNLQQPKWMYLKALLLVFIGLLSAAMLLAMNPTGQTAVLMGLAIWASCRLYYFAFYVIEHYIDPGYHYSGICSACLHFMRKSSAYNKKARRSSSGPML
jgi:hypothetical protein